MSALHRAPELAPTTAPSTWRVQTITSYAELLALAPTWWALEADGGVDLPFQTWEWATSWWEHLHEDRVGVRDSLRVCVVREPSGQVVAIAPLMVTERPAIGPLRARFVQFLGADPNLTELRLIVCRPGLEPACYAAIQAHLAASPDAWDWVTWEGPAGPGGAVDGLRGRLEEPVVKPAYVLALPATWGELRARLKRNIKESLRKCYNSLEREGLQYALEVLDQPAEIERALADLFRLHAARAQLPGTVAHANVFESAQARAFISTLCRRLAERGIARLFQLRVGGRLVAARLGFEMGDTLYLYYSGWDPAYAAYSVMTTLVSETIQHAIRRGLKTVHLSTGRDVSKTRWGATELCYVSGVELAPRRSARVKHLAYAAAARIGKSRPLRVLAPSSFVRRAGAAMGRERARTAMLGLLGPAAVLVVLDWLDGVLDGALHLLPRALG